MLVDNLLSLSPSVISSGIGHLLTKKPNRAAQGMVQLPQDIASRLPETVEVVDRPGYYAYGVSAYHQLHCLNRIRQSFYPDRFFPDDSKEEIIFHKSMSGPILCPFPQTLLTAPFQIIVSIFCDNQSSAAAMFRWYIGGIRITRTSTGRGSSTTPRSIWAGA
jgi:hypothetical protein